MARRTKAAIREDQEAEINMTPMLDMVFILLIFFIVTTSFVKSAGVTVNKPSAVTSAPVPNGNILIGVTAQGQVWMNKNKIPVSSVRPQVEKFKSQSPKSSVVIVTDRGAPTGTVIQVMDQARLAGVSHVSIAATPSSGAG
jgi:biopolymer transport protein ExbD